MKYDSAAWLRAAEPPCCWETVSCVARAHSACELYAASLADASIIIMIILIICISLCRLGHSHAHWDEEHICSHNYFTCHERERKYFHIILKGGWWALTVGANPHPCGSCPSPTYRTSSGVLGGLFVSVICYHKALVVYVQGHGHFLLCPLALSALASINLRCRSHAHDELSPSVWITQRAAGRTITDRRG